MRTCLNAIGKGRSSRADCHEGQLGPEEAPEAQLSLSAMNVKEL